MNSGMVKRLLKTGGMLFSIITIIGFRYTVGASNQRVLFIPFEDKVKLKEAWDLSVDVPRWFTTTIDTVEDDDTLIETVSFDSVQSVISQSNWKVGELVQPRLVGRLASRFGADVVVHGRIDEFKAVKRGINTDAQVGVAHQFSRSSSGQGGAKMMGGLDASSAKVRMTLFFHDGVSGEIIDTIALDTEKKDGGINVWIPFQTENDDLNFYHTRTSPFGSVHFQKNILGQIMNHFSGEVHNRIIALKLRGNENIGVQTLSREFIEGKILDRAENEVYINLGSEDRVFKGEILEVMKPDRPVTDESGDTLGWVESRVGAVKIRSLKSNHFSQAIIVEEKDSLEAGWTVRSQK